ncbi:MarR family winged helix-turn-helix transcriptional regulator [Wenxinia marina]|uniref:Transcriptional regulator n=1 Tax=Wenxinia marina DSM 24838 TaxID=1123501 RepID=A0A0D0QH79_9RHOB|nr:MarR family transcriptional regulator [Wenxinia marina]KIQ70418.1 Transcriptional regulator [Wenxinia marina DSM 24838]GGL53325.1 MarR family transcriptional regulator [Wenxinia marina]
MRDAADTAPPPGLDDGEVRYGPLADSLGLLLRLSQLVAFGHFYDDLAEMDVRPGEMSVLMLLAENPGIRQGTLARALVIKRAHMTKMVRALEEKGWIERRVPPDDRRAVELRLTEAGACHVETLRGPFLAHEAVAGRGLSDADHAELRRLLRAYLGMPDPEGPR